MTDAAEQSESEAQLRRGLARSTTGTAADIDWESRTVTVLIGGIPRSLSWVGPAPLPGAPVRVSVLGTTTYCQVLEGASLGTLQTFNDSLATVLGDDGHIYQYQYPWDINFASGDRVILDHGRQVVMLRLSTTPPPPPPDEASPPPGPAPTRIARDFFPAWSGSWWNGTLNSDLVNVGSTTLGAYGHGTSIRDTIPDHAVVEAATLHLDQVSDRLPNIATLIGTHNFDGRPGTFTNAAINGAWPIPGGSHAININGEIIGRFIRGEAFGIAMRSGQSWRTYNRSPSGRIHVQWLQ